jgi:two-component sensor histidine kinase
MPVSSISARQRWLPVHLLWIGIFWLAFGVVDAMQTVLIMHAEGMHHAWVKLFIVTIISWLPWAIATPFIMELGRRFPPTKLRPITGWITHIAACAAIALTYSGWVTTLHRLFNPYADTGTPDPFLHAWINRFDNFILASIVLYAAVLAITYALDSRARLAYQQTETARLNEQLTKAQLDALRRQIEPHFLFNTLNSVAGLVREHKNDDAVRMIAELSDFLRRVISDSAKQQVPLREEMDFAQKYLDIQKVRFVDRLQLSVDVPAELLGAQVPTLILQPIVENAIKHGIAKRSQGGAIRIAAARSNGFLTLSVYNDGPGLASNGGAPGIGISNMRTRLASLYGDAFCLDMKNQQPGGVEVSVSVPFKE